MADADNATYFYQQQKNKPPVKAKSPTAQVLDTLGAGQPYGRVKAEEAPINRVNS